MQIEHQVEPPVREVWEMLSYRYRTRFAEKLEIEYYK